MKNSTKLELRKSEIRDALLDDNLDSEKRDELVTELRETESPSGVRRLRWRKPRRQTQTKSATIDPAQSVELRAYFDHAISQRRRLTVRSVS